MVIVGERVDASDTWIQRFTEFAVEVTRNNWELVGARIESLVAHRLIHDHELLRAVGGKGFELGCFLHSATNQRRSGSY